MSGGDVIETGTVMVDYVIREWVLNDGSKAYDYIAGSNDSDDLYDSLIDAREAAIRSLEY